MWLAAVVTLTFPPSGAFRLDVQMGRGGYKKAPLVHVRFDRQGPAFQPHPGRAARSMAQSLQCR